MPAWLVSLDRAVSNWIFLGMDAAAWNCMAVVAVMPHWELVERGKRWLYRPLWLIKKVGFNWDGPLELTPRQLLPACPGISTSPCASAILCTLDQSCAPVYLDHLRSRSVLRSAFAISTPLSPIWKGPQFPARFYLLESPVAFLCLCGTRCVYLACTSLGLVDFSCDCDNKLELPEDTSYTLTNPLHCGVGLHGYRWGWFPLELSPDSWTCCAQDEFDMMAVFCLLLLYHYF